MATIATHNGSAVRQAHNMRTESCLAKEKHIDPARPHEVWKHETIGHAYHRLFDEARADYNARQARADRKLTGTYLSEIQKDEKKHPCYEMIIGVYGDEVQEQVSRQIMKDFVDGWEKRNPNLELIGAYYHADEEGKNPHVHLDYIPVGHGYKRGPETQTGLVKAFEEQGIVKKGRATAQIQWEARENSVLEKLCQERGLSIEHPQAGKEQIKHAETRVYKADQRAKTAERQAERLEAKAVRAEIRVQRAESRVQEQERHLSGLQDSISVAKQEKREALRERDQARAEVDVQKAVRDAVKGFERPLKASVEVLAESPAKTSIFGKTPATVTVRKSDFEQLEDLRRVAYRAEQAAARMEQARNETMQQAKIVRQNKIDSYEVAVDQRVQDAEERERIKGWESDRAVEEAQRAEQQARQAEQTARQAKEQAKQQLRQTQAQLRQMQEIMAFFPKDWKQMQERTAKARELEELYYKAQNGESDSRISESWGRTYFKLDGQEVGYRGLLDAYRETCSENHIAHDTGMWEHLDKLIERDHDMEWER